MMNPAEFANIAKSEQTFWWYRGMREILFRILDPLIAQRTIRHGLDAGCGTGYFAKVVEQRYKIPTFAIDYGWPGLEFARQMRLSRLAQCDIRTLPFPTGSFDLVLSMDVIVHFPRGEEQSALSELSRVLSPNGLIAIRVSALDILRSRHSQFAHERQRFTRNRLCLAAEQAGLRVLRCTYANTLLSPVALAKFRIWEPLTKQPPASGVGEASWTDLLLYAPLALEAELVGRGLDFPFGQSLILLAERANS